MRKWRTATRILIALGLLGTGQAQAQVLADRVPADAIAYAGWAGTDALGTAYDASHLKAFLNTLNLPQFLAARLEEKMSAQTDAQSVQDAALVKQWLTVMAKSQTALYFGGIDFTNGAQPMPHLGLFSKVGKENADALADQLDAMLHRGSNADAPLHGVLAVGDYLLFYVGDKSMQERLAGAAPADNLASNEAFTRTIKQLGPAVDGSVAVVYADAQAGLKALTAIVQNQPNAMLEQILPVILEGSGVANLRQAAWAGKFDGANWRSSGFIGMNDRRTGLLAFLDNAPLTDATFKMIPRDATTAGVYRFDGSRLLSDIADTAARLSDQAPRQLEQAYQQIYAVTGVDLKRELLPSLGDEFVYYGSPGAAGDSLRGFTIMNKLRDPAKAASAMEAAENFINLLILQRVPDSKAQFRTQALAAPLDKVTAHVMTLPNAAPSWAINDGTLFFSLSVQGLQSAMETAASTGAAVAKGGILDNPQFMALRQSLGQDAIGAFAYADLAKGFSESYEIVSRALARAQADNPVAHPYTLPPLDKLMPDLGPALMIQWTDGAGFHTRGAGPFPFSGYLDPAQFLTLRLAEMVEARQARPAAPARGVAPTLP